MTRLRFWATPRGTARLVLVGLIVIYVGLLKWAYIAYVAPSFAYAGYHYIPAGMWQECLSWLCSLLPVVWLPLDIDRPSRLPLWFQYLVVYIPSASIPLYNAAPGSRSVWPLVAAILVALIILQALTSLPRLNFPVLRITPTAYRIGLIGLGIALLVPIVRAFGVPHHIPTLADVYDVRADYSDTVAAAGIIVAYAVNWFARVVSPLLMLEGVYYRKVWLALIGFAGSVYIFSLSGMKGVALFGCFVAALRLVYRPGGRRMGVLVAAALSGVVVVSILVAALTKKFVLASLFIRRALVLPGLLTGYYYQFYSTHPHVHLGASVLRSLAGYQYDAVPQAIIGAVYFGDPTTNANVNVWGDAFLNFGLPGILFFAGALGMILWAFDGVASHRSSGITCLMLAIPSLVLTNGALTTAMLTDGLALTFALAALLPPADERAPPRSDSG